MCAGPREMMLVRDVLRMRLSRRILFIGSARRVRGAYLFAQCNHPLSIAAITIRN